MIIYFIFLLSNLLIFYLFLVSFTFIQISDRVFDSLSNTKDIYREYVQSIIDSAINGYNGTILAYGQTASGKTHTIFGSGSEDGIIQMAIRSIFDAIASVRIVN